MRRRACICGVAGCRRHRSKPIRQGPNPYGGAWQRLRRQAEKELPLWCGLGRHPILEGQPKHLDHILPRSLGGQDVMENVQWSCPTHNISKGGANRIKR